MAARRVNPKRDRPFMDYALLGDDIVICDAKVASAYREGELGVTISLAKSLISRNGTFEFAKRYWKGGVNLSPISMRSLMSCRIGLTTIAHKYDVGIRVLQRLGGAGYRTLSRLQTTQSRRWERLKAAAAKPLRSSALPLEWWIGRGMPLNPYLKGRIVRY